MISDFPKWRSSLLRARSPQFGNASRSFLGRVFVRAVKDFRSDMLQLVAQLARGDLSVQRFSSQSLRRVREAYLLVYSLGALSVDPFHTVTHRDVRVVNNEISGERRFLRKFARDISGGRLVIDPGIRANLYVRALRGMFELGRIEALPSGPYEWVLGDTDHCEPCLSASVRGPYQRERFSGLGLPVLPGIPGSGDLCRGLTRCGCTTRLVSRLEPNSQLQDEMRGLLAEILHEE